MEVIERVKTSQPDLVISDYNMPLVDGQTVVRTVRRLDPSLPVVILTAKRDPAKEAMLGTIGVQRILHKPVKGEDLVLEVKEILARR